jgi:hypothetical protein
MSLSISALICFLVRLLVSLLLRFWAEKFRGWLEVWGPTRPLLSIDMIQQNSSSSNFCLRHSADLCASNLALLVRLPPTLKLLSTTHHLFALPRSILHRYTILIEERRRENTRNACMHGLGNWHHGDLFVSFTQ